MAKYILRNNLLNSKSTYVLYPSIRDRSEISIWFYRGGYNGILRRAKLAISLCQTVSRRCWDEKILYPPHIVLKIECNKSAYNSIEWIIHIYSSDDSHLIIWLRSTKRGSYHFYIHRKYFFVIARHRVLMIRRKLCSSTRASHSYYIRPATFWIGIIIKYGALN